jgi:hypothetical protein
MNEIQDTISFGYGTGLNWDDDLMPKGDGKYRKNVSLEEGGHHGVLTRTRGNSQNLNILDQEAAMSSFAPAIVGSYARYSYAMTNDYLWASGTFANAGTALNIKTDSGYYKLFHKNTFTTLVAACENLKSRIESLGDIYIGAVSYTVGAPTTTFNIDILQTCTVQGIQHFVFKYGNNSHTTFYMPGKEIVGTYYDKKDNELYCFWAYDALASPSPWSDNIITVYRYDDDLMEILNSTYLTIPSTLAKWDKQNPIKAVVVSDADDKLLYWTDGVSGIMKINVNTALNTAYGYYGDTYSNHNTDILRKEALSVAKIVPVTGYAPTSGIDGAGEKGSNVDIMKYPCQYMYRYVFDDNEKSNWSTVSESNDFAFECADGYIMDEAKCSQNTIWLTSLTSNTIKYVEMAFRRYLGDSWKSFKVEPVDAFNQALVVFKGVETLMNIADSEANKLFDNIPIQSGTLSLIPSSHLVFGDNTVGYNNVVTDVELTAVAYEPTTIDGPDQPLFYLGFTAASATSKTIDLSHITGNIYVYLETLANSYIFTVPEGSTDQVTPIVDYINNNIVGVDPYIASAACPASTLTINHTSGKWVKGYVCSMVFYEKPSKIKNGATHYTCLFYYDQFGRMCYAQPLDPTYVPFYTEQVAYTNNEYLDALQLEITHQPPVWAHYWSIGYGLSNVQSYKQFLVKVGDFERGNGIFKIETDSVINLTREMLPSLNLSYSYTKGDRIRWIGTLGTTSDDGVTFNRVTLLPEYIDSEIIGLSGEWSEFMVIPDYNSYPTSAALLDAATYVLVEFYTPLKTTEPTFYYETSYKFAVTNPGTATAYHNVTLRQSSDYGITVRNQTAGVTAICYLDKMDFRLHQFWCFDSGVPLSCYMDSEDYSNYYASRMKNIGRSSIENKDARQVRLNNLIWTNAFIPDTRVNGLSNANFTNEKKIDDKFGRITAIEVAGDILTVIQQSKISSVYLGAELAIDANGNQTVSYTGEVIGNVRPRAEDYGSDYKHSILRVGASIYGFDMQSSAVWRTDYNGTQNLTDYGRKMKTYITAKCQTLIASGKENLIVVTGFDYQKQLFYITFKDLSNAANNETLAFHEPTNRWISFYDFIPDMYASIENLQFLTIKSGYLYAHESATATRSNFYGTTYDSLVHATCNIYPSEIKVWNSIKEDANAIWDMPDNDSIVIDEEDIEFTNTIDYTHHKSGMQSRLNSARFRYKNGNFHAAFLNDMTTNGAASQYDLFTGRKLRGRYITCKLENNDNAAVYLRSIQVNGQKSN